MRLLIDVVNAGSPGGLQHQVELARSAERCCPAGAELVLLRADGGTDYRIEGSDRMRVIAAERAAGWTGLRRWYGRELPRMAREQRADVVYSLGILSRQLCRSVATVNSVNNMLPFTPEHIRHFRPLSRDWLRLVILQRAYVWSCQRADALVLPSRHGLERVNHFAGNLSSKAFVAMNPAPEYTKYDPSRPPPHPYGGRSFLFYLSVVVYYKNHLNLIEAYRRIVRAGGDLPDLIMAGPSDDVDYETRIGEAIRAGGLADRVKYLGKIPREDIPGWLHHATVNVFPSTCETNSFVQSEILGAAGVMACSNIPPMPEIAGAAAELFDPYSPESIGKALVRLCGDPARREELRRLAVARAAEFTRDACGRVMWQAAQHAHQAFHARRRGGARESASAGV